VGGLVVLIIIWEILKGGQGSSECCIRPLPSLDEGLYLGPNIRVPVRESAGIKDFRDPRILDEDIRNAYGLAARIKTNVLWLQGS